MISSLTPQFLIRSATLLLLSSLTACTTFNELLGTTRAPAPPAALPVHERPMQEPVTANRFVIESPQQSVVGELQVVLTREEDTFSDLARAYGLGYDELVAANPGVDPWLPGEQTAVLLPTQFVLPDTPRKGIVLNIATKRLFYYPQMPAGQPQVVITYPIGIGRVGWETPLGSASVVAKAVNPSWFVPASVRREHAEMGDPLPAVVPPGPDNPLGTRVLQLDLPGYLIHGTNQPYGVGMRVSHGCVRLYPENIESLYELVAIGEPVQIINEPFLAGFQNGRMMFEAHAPLEDDTISAEDRLHSLIVRLGESGSYELSVEAERNVRKAAADTAGFPVYVERYNAAEALLRAIHVRNIVEADPNAPTLSEVRQMMQELMQEDDQS